MTFQQQELWIQATMMALWPKSQWAHRVFDLAEAIWPVKIGYARWVTGERFDCKTSSALLKTPCIVPIATSSIEPFLYIACIHASWPWNIS